MSNIEITSKFDIQHWVFDIDKKQTLPMPQCHPTLQTG